MNNRVATINAEGQVGRPQLDVFGNAYDVAHTRQRIGDGYFVVIPPCADAERVAEAVEEIKSVVLSRAEPQPKKVKAGPAAKRKAKDEN